MTVESALAKLSFVIGKEELTREDRKMVSFMFVFEVCYLIQAQVQEILGDCMQSRIHFKFIF